MLEEKYSTYCSRCSDNPPFFLDDKISSGLCYNAWCLFCYKSGDKEPTLFWERGRLDRVYYKCDICDWESPAGIPTSPKFDKALKKHFIKKHNMHIQEVIKKVSGILTTEMMHKYLPKKLEE
jgi:hypothetical protein